MVVNPPRPGRRCLGRIQQVPIGTPLPTARLHPFLWPPNPGLYMSLCATAGSRKRMIAKHLNTLNLTAPSQCAISGLGCLAAGHEKSPRLPAEMSRTTFPLPNPPPTKTYLYALLWTSRDPSFKPQTLLPPELMTCMVTYTVWLGFCLRCATLRVGLGRTIRRGLGPPAVDRFAPLYFALCGLKWVPPSRQVSGSKRCVTPPPHPSPPGHPPTPPAPSPLVWVALLQKQAEAGRVALKLYCCTRGPRFGDDKGSRCKIRSPPSNGAQGPVVLQGL